MNEQVDPKLLELLICPNCRGEISYLPEQARIVCTGECGYRYPVVDGIPHMLIEEAEKP